MLEDPAPLNVLVEPAAQTWPPIDERLMGHGDCDVVDRHEASPHEQVEDFLLALVEIVPRHSRSPQLSLVTPDDQPKHQGPQDRPLGQGECRVDGLGGVGERSAHATARSVSSDCQGASLASTPGLGQRMGEERKSHGRLFEVP